MSWSGDMVNSVAENGGKKFQNKILHSIDNKHWAASLIPSQLWLVRNFNIKTKADVIDFEALFSEKDVQHLQSTSKNFKVDFWSEIINHPLIVDANKANRIILSSPAFDKSFNYAIFYI